MWLRVRGSAGGPVRRGRAQCFSLLRLRMWKSQDSYSPLTKGSSPELFWHLYHELPVVVSKKMIPKGNSIIRRHGFVGVGVALLEKVCDCGGGL